MNSNFSINSYYTDELTKDVMQHCARELGLDIHDDNVADTMFKVCSELEEWPEDKVFGTSDYFTFVELARKAVNK